MPFESQMTCSQFARRHFGSCEPSASTLMRAAQALATRVLLSCACLLLAPCHAAQPLDLAALRGRVVYLDFWASWCAPCRQSFPWMQAMKNTYEPQGLSVIAVSLDHDRADAERFLRKFHPDFEVRFDPQGLLAEQFKVAGMPTSVVIDRHGVMRFSHIGFQPADERAFANELQRLLAEK
jgi:thiol-disulfide isomerase/thioredoxin